MLFWELTCQVNETIFLFYELFTQASKSWYCPNLFIIFKFDRSIIFWPFSFDNFSFFHFDLSFWLLNLLYFNLLLFFNLVLFLDSFFFYLLVILIFWWGFRIFFGWLLGWRRWRWRRWLWLLFLFIIRGMSLLTFGWLLFLFWPCLFGKLFVLLLLNFLFLLSFFFSSDNLCLYFLNFFLDLFVPILIFFLNIFLLIIIRLLFKLTISE